KTYGADHSYVQMVFKLSQTFSHRNRKANDIKSLVSKNMAIFRHSECFRTFAQQFALQISNRQGITFSRANTC
ncbi:hypothetical protein, partial [Vibrio sp. F13]|uniref:hypothetical protein n=1 Tax=Vibrio sp. F13 TaxID=2070777 RepID=UPI0019CF61A4